MARLHIYVNEIEGKTVSKFGKPKDSDKIVFHNQHATGTLTVVINSDPQFGNALCKGTQPVTTFTVAPTAKEAFSICNAYQGEMFKYTAQINGFQLEDPIIIIEKSGFTIGPVAFTTVIVVTAAAAALGFFLGLKLARGGSPKN
jgi:hypothetical protein